MSSICSYVASCVACKIFKWEKGFRGLHYNWAYTILYKVQYLRDKTFAVFP